MGCAEIVVDVCNHKKNHLFSAFALHAACRIAKGTPRKKKLQKEQFQVFNTQLLTGCMHTSYFLHVYRKVCNMRFCWTGTPFMDCDNSKRVLKGGVQSDK